MKHWSLETQTKKKEQDRRYTLTAMILPFLFYTIAFGVRHDYDVYKWFNYQITSSFCLPFVSCPLCRKCNINPTLNIPM